MPDIKSCFTIYNNLFTYQTFYPVELTLDKKIKFYDFLQGKCPMSSAMPSQNFSSKQTNPPFFSLSLFFHAIFRRQNKAILFHIVERKLKSVTPLKGGPRSCLYITITCAFHRHMLTDF